MNFETDDSVASSYNEHLILVNNNSDNLQEHTNTQNWKNYWEQIRDFYTLRSDVNRLVNAYDNKLHHQPISSSRVKGIETIKIYETIIKPEEGYEKRLEIIPTDNSIEPIEKVPLRGRARDKIIRDITRKI